MANSLITRCPKCSTAFRVSDEVLSMAKGKVRCGQCFHIFDASKLTDSKTASGKSSIETVSQQDIPATKEAAQPATQSKTTDKLSDVKLTPPEEIVNPDWLQTLFDDEDLSPPSEDALEKLTSNNEQSTKSKSSHDAYQETPQQQPNLVTKTTKRATTATEQNEPAPWEVELAEVEAALKATSSTPTPSTKKPIEKPPLTEASTLSAPTTEPDYMVALHSLAQSASEQTRPSDAKNQHSILEQLSAQQSLAPLLEENEPAARKKNTHPWLWFFASLLGAALLFAQVATHFFVEGSSSSNFRSFYRTICSYSGCVLPRFEDVSAITIQHVRIQSHPSIPNTLLVNAIITNTSNFSQPMPKIALEFFDLNGLPVAARLFAPSDYLHKDFLDITYMPPNTPIHLVIPIQDPGARAVTHQLRSFPTDTRSY
ncbi:zinc-ribbon and DUF3426 domain-containing protein [Marinomonas profundimaris]|uniref:Zinc finger/thioredoxin putative domain-containing protein n=1 Tax=Marinomonas profundimaris TaxID=1208321 RepID=W1RPE5_9GAMM|nr:zinc-ribbon and DUF3426 domain-containing protein [Marinomonas profundimaris]ETI58716.1 hypothetical protein D104_14135 [Marinomonas profundimaris]